MMRASGLVLAIAASALAQAPTATFRPSQLFGNHMVMPAEASVPCWGTGAPGAAVLVEASWGKSAKATVAADGTWRCELATADRGGPHELVLRCGDDVVRCMDVLLGDVWLGSGQSNMEMPVAPGGGFDGVRNWQQEVAAASHEPLRVFTVERTTSPTPATDVHGTWQVCSPATVGAMSATGYFFARELLQHGHQPLGLVISSWGGTVAEAWTSPAGLAKFPEFADELAASMKERGGAARGERVAAFWRAVDAASSAASVPVVMPELWSRGDLGDFDGVASYSRTIELPAAFVGQDLWLELGAIDDMDTVWWNDTRVGGHEDDGAWSTRRRYRVPSTCNGKATASVRVRVVDTGGEGGFSAAADDLRLRLGKDETKSVALAGAWQRARGPSMQQLPTWPREGDRPNRPAVLWHGMIAPLVPFPFTGVIWYQGESNRTRPEQYAQLFPALVQDWRRAFGRELPFYCVQIAPYAYSGGAAEQTVLLREAQAAILSLPHTGMVVTLDCGDEADIHPTDKQTVGLRLARLAQHDHYGESVDWAGPTCEGVEVLEHELRLRFGMATRGLELRNDGAGFEVAAADRRFVTATARVDGDCVLLASAIVKPAYVRYAYGSAPLWSLRNGAGLPAAPFRRSIP